MKVCPREFNTELIIATKISCRQVLLFTFSLVDVIYNPVNVNALKEIMATTDTNAQAINLSEVTSIWGAFDAISQ